MNAEEIAATIEAHLSTGIGCQCGWRISTAHRTLRGQFDPRGQHRTHVAEQIAALMPEATETVEHALRHRDGWIAGPGDVEAMRAMVADPGYPGAVAVMRRTRTTYADRVSEWEAAGDE